MIPSNTDFSLEQWEFLSVFEALGEPVSLDIVGALSPLLPTVLLDTLTRSEKANILRKNGDNLFCLSPDLPDTIQRKIKKINQKERCSNLMDRLEDLDLIDKISRESYLNLITRSGRGGDGTIELEMAREALNGFQYDKAQVYLEKALTGLFAHLEQSDNRRVIITSVLEYSDICFMLGRKFISSLDFLEKAASVAIQLGDKRSEAMIKLHLGRLFYINNRRHEAVEIISQGQADISELGDEDIKVRASEFIALLYYMKGRLSEAMTYFEIGINAVESRKDIQMTSLLAPTFYGYCAAYLGQFHKAIGYLDTTWRRAKRESNKTLAVTVRSVLGTILLLIDKKREAEGHLQQALKDATSSQNAFGKFLALGGLAFLRYKEGNIKAAADIMQENVREAEKVGILQQYSSPWVLEMFFDFSRVGHLPLSPRENLKNVSRILNDPNDHLKGVMLRIIAEYSLQKSLSRDQFNNYYQLARKILPAGNRLTKTPSEIELLKVSENYLELSGNPIELAKTRIQMALFELGQGNKEVARDLAQKARRGLSGFWEDHFPDAIRALLDESADQSQKALLPFTAGEDPISLLADLDLYLDMDQFFARLVSTMNRYLSAERGGLFWARDRKSDSLELRVSRNLNRTETALSEFQTKMNLIRKCFQDGQPYVIRSNGSAGQSHPYGVLAILCLPLKSRGHIRGVLYHDNSYLEDCFDFLDPARLNKIIDILNIHIERMNQIENLAYEVKESTLQETAGLEQGVNLTILTQSASMAETLTQIDRFARSDSTVLIQGETGVGKELLAHRLHQMSPRSKKPFIIVDPTTVPENLVESELFGHEKGSFTGADHQKRGRLELAHEGTLFIDEIGEIPKSIQVKLLRVLQEKTFCRIGGNQTIHSDFRLVAATNRNLAEEVAKGNFREDLFYRLHILPISVPPLRDRQEDIHLLSRHFLNIYTKKYSRPRLTLNPEIENRLSDYHWPGNVRELINVIERSVILSKEDNLELNLQTNDGNGQDLYLGDTPTLNELERRYIQHILQKTKGRIAGSGGAADLLGLKPSTLYSRMSKLQIPRCK